MIVQSTETLAYDPASLRERLFAFAIVVLLVATLAIDARFAAIPHVHGTGIVAIAYALSVFALALTGWMLLALYRIRKFGPLGILGSAFALLAAMYLAVLLLTHGVIDGIMADDAAAQAVTCVRVGARLIFPLLLVAYAIADLRERRVPGSSRAIVVPVIAGACVVTLATILGAILYGTLLPPFVTPTGRLSPFYVTIVFPSLMTATVVAAFVVLLAGTRKSRIRTWLFAVLCAQCAAIVAVLLGGGLDTVGIYAVHGYELIGAVLFLFVVQAQIDGVLRRARHTGERAHALSQIIAVGDSQSLAGIEAMLERVAREFSFDYVGLTRATQDEIEIELALGTPGPSRGTRKPLEGSMTRRAIESRAPIYVDDFKDPEVAGFRKFTDSDWSSCCVMPVYAGNGPYGILAFANGEPRARPITPLERDFLSLVALLVGNVVERMRQRERLDALAYSDALTGLPNRVSLVNRISHEIYEAQGTGARVAVHFLDLNDFKPINDRFGHAVGDFVLREVGRRLQHVVRTDGFVGRYGGDEFVVVQTVADAVTTGDLSARLKNAFREPIAVPVGTFDVSFSVGTSIFPHDGSDAHSLLVRADDAQYAQKNARRANRSNRTA